MDTPNLDALIASVRMPEKPTGVPFAQVGSMMGAQANGAMSGQMVIPPILARIRREPHLLASLPGLVEAAIEAGAAVLVQAEMPAADVQAWKVGFVNAANTLVRPFFQEMQALADASPIVDLIDGAGERPALPDLRQLRADDLRPLLPQA